MAIRAISRIGFVVAGALALSGCITSPEEREALERAAYEEQVRLQAMIEAGECRERRMTGMRTRVVYECGDEDRDMTQAAQESVRRMQHQGTFGPPPDAPQ